MQPAIYALGGALFQHRQRVQSIVATRGVRERACLLAHRAAVSPLVLSSFRSALLPLCGTSHQPKHLFRVEAVASALSPCRETSRHCRLWVQRAWYVWACIGVATASETEPAWCD